MVVAAVPSSVSASSTWIWSIETETTLPMSGPMTGRSLRLIL